MKSMINDFLLVRDKFIPDMHLRLPKFTCIVPVD